MKIAPASNCLIPASSSGGMSVTPFFEAIQVVPQSMDTIPNSNNAFARVLKFVKKDLLTICNRDVYRAFLSALANV